MAPATDSLLEERRDHPHPADGTAAAYALGESDAEAARLRVLDAVYGSTSRALLADTGLAAGWCCLDVGCGTGLITHWLGEKVGASGGVLGVDISDRFLAQARGASKQHFVHHVQFSVSDAAAVNLGEATFDLVYARCLLSHLHDPLAVLQRMAALTKPGGVICVEDIDCGTGLPVAASPAHLRYWQLYRAVIAHHGGDPSLGRKLPRLFHAAGLKPAHVGVVSPTEPAEDIRRLSPLTLASLRPALLRAQLAAAAEVDDLIGALHSIHHTTAACPMVQVWARKSIA